jgi:hypothetical protein
LVGYESSLCNHVLPVFADRPVADISYRDCKAFVDNLLRDGLAPGTVGEARKMASRRTTTTHAGRRRSVARRLGRAGR